MNNSIYSVSQLNQAARLLLEQLGFIWLTGEISNFSQPVSGHWYLTLKDENAQVRCAMFRMKNARVSFRPQNGMQVLVRANVSLYEPRGDYQLIIESMQPAGDGLLQQQFDALKMKLASEGLFAQNLKKNLPHFSRKVGIITSLTGAALQDILHILARRDPTLAVVIYPTAVQGDEASAEIVQMIELANQRQEVDVLIVGRGGGSLEDLNCFNQENVARAIFRSVIPIISAVGHETDITIADFVADVRAATPSAAAELVSRDQKELQQQLLYKQQRLEMAIDRLFQYKNQQLKQALLRLQAQHPLTQLHQQHKQIQQLQHRLQFALQQQYEKKSQKLTALYTRLQQNPLPYQLKRQQQTLNQLHIRLQFAIKKYCQQQQYHFTKLTGQLDHLSPLKVLNRGYSVTQNMNNIPLTSIEQLSQNQQVKTQLADGYFFSQITALHKEK
ncbi:exodeoxyribonuclease VII large subunit [Volucribacter amazonae]|uniref:Exodeoxyribonuclease 7 large subunit n=1 Tax=Volucribacter amazonae TaxID=256731 RepID=A0A9X4PF81_9PAST|nr:exodeoxyribonuclease VII large subunit [Volucribacter amazonae]MDG6896164.1 exodeoxyribonuclease VII large subunit [Volucribacter amazonae]